MRGLWLLWLLAGVGAGCIERRAPGVDGVEGDGAGVDRAGVDAGVDAAGDAGADAAVDAVVDAVVDAAVDLGADAAVDQGLVFEGEGVLSTTVGPAVCPAVVRTDEGWWVAGAVDRDAYDGRVNPEVGVVGIDRSGRVVSRSGVVLGPSVSGVRWVVGAGGAGLLVGGRGEERSPGVGGAAELWWWPVGEGEGVRLGAGVLLGEGAEAGDAVFDGAGDGEGVAVLHSLEGGLVWARLAGGVLGAGQRVSEGGVAFARLVEAPGGFVGAWGGAGRVMVAGLDRAGAVRWRVERAIAAEPVDLRVVGDGVEVGLAVPDPGLDGGAFAVGHGRPMVWSLAVADGAVRGERALVDAVVRGGGPSLGDAAAVWPRLRVDGDRNRTEVMLSADGGVRRVTRAHGFSFCPVLAGAHGERVLTAWIDTRDGREDTFVYVGSVGEIAVDDVPEPTPAPPVPPGDCVAPGEVTEAFVRGFDGVPAGAGLWVGWIEQAVDGAGRTVLGTARVAGVDAVDAGARWAVEGAVARVAVAWVGPVAGLGPGAGEGEGEGVLAAEIEGEIAVFRGGERVLTVPGALVAMAGVGPRLVIVRRGEDGALAAVLAVLDDAGGPQEPGDPPEPGDPQEPGEPQEPEDPGGASARVVAVSAPFRSGAAAVAARGDELLIAWVDGPGAAGEQVVVERVELEGRVPIARLAAGIDAGELRFVGQGGRVLLAWSAHAGRAFARDLRVSDLRLPGGEAAGGEAAGGEAGGEVTVAILPGDPASSRFPAPTIEGERRWVAWVENRPVERVALHIAAAEAGSAVFGAPERLAVGGVSPGDLRLAVVAGVPLIVRRSGVQLLVDSAPARCRVPGATAP